MPKECRKNRLLFIFCLILALTCTVNHAFPQNLAANIHNFIKNKSEPSSIFMESNKYNAIQVNEIPNEKIWFLMAADDAAITAFVTRFYHECLNREPDPEGLNGYIKGLKNHWISGGRLAEEFFLSTEFNNFNKSDEDFLVILYQAFFDRKPDMQGFNGWLTALGNGYTRPAILKAFIRSDEFANLCNRYGIIPQDPIEAFVTRFYRKCLNREPDLQGLEGWVTGLKNGSVTGDKLAEGFVLSSEFINRAISNEIFLEILYHAFFNRNPDIGGFNGWLAALDNGMNRSEVLSKFICSEEFFTLCTQYGISPGKGCGEQEPNPEPICSDVSGYWNVSDTLTMECCIDGTCITETFSEISTIYLKQEGCNISFDVVVPGGGYIARSGTINGDEIILRGTFMILHSLWVQNENFANFTGSLENSGIQISGDGTVKASYDGSNLSCSGRYTTILTR